MHFDSRFNVLRLTVLTLPRLTVFNLEVSSCTAPHERKRTSILSFNEPNTDVVCVFCFHIFQL